MGHRNGCPGLKLSYLCVMFVRKKKNKSGVVSIQVIDKKHGKYKVVKTIGSSSDILNIELLFQQGKQWISSYSGEQDIFEQATREIEEKQVTEYLLSNIEKILINGTQLILDKVYKIIGFDNIDDDILKHLLTSTLLKFIFYN